MIFGIGLSKTGTTSLFAALARLGYRSGTYRHMRILGIEDWIAGDFTLDHLSGFDALTDLPLATYYLQLDRRYPSSKFILTVRAIDSWLESARVHFSRPPASSFGRDLRLATYGVTGFNRDRFRTVYESHVEGVCRHFRTRPADLLVLDIVAGDGWEKLCRFLDRPIPDEPFPNVQPGFRLPSEQEGDAQ